MPLVFWAVTAWVAGTAAGLAGWVTLPWACALGAAGAGWDWWRRDGRGVEATVGLCLVAVTAVAYGGDARVADVRCVATLRAQREWTVLVLDAATPGSFVRGRSSEHGCHTSVALAVRLGEAAAGATVRVTHGEASDGPRGLLVREAVLRAVEAPGALARWRTRVSARLDRRFGSDAGIVKALLIADTRGLSPELREVYANAGLVHILSISGLHVAIVGGALLLLFQAMRLPTIGARGAAVAVSVLYVVAIGAPAPAVRSVTLFAVVALAKAWQRPIAVWGVFALGAVVPLLDPRTVLDLGYQLSVGGYGAVVVAGRAGRRWVPESGAGWRGNLARELIAGVLTTAATAPLIAWHFGRLSLVAPLSNIFAGPIVSLLQPTLFLAMVLPVDSFARVTADAAWPMLRALDGVARAAASAPGASVLVAPTLLTALISAVAILGLLVAGWARQWRRPLTIALGALSVLAWMPSGATVTSGDLELHLLDVGQGDAVALRTPRGRWVLVDAGRAWSSGDAGRSTVIPHLRRYGGELALFVLTHPHADHIGGAASVVAALRPRAIRDAAFVAGTPMYRELLFTTEGTEVEWGRVRPGEVIDVDGVRFEFLAPDSAWTEAQADPNLASTVVRATFGAFSVLLTGDAEREEEEWLLRRASSNDLRSTVLKVGHHGSSTSTTPAFLDAVAPRMALVSVGAGNVYRHPSSAVMQRLTDAGATVLRTDQLGTVILRTNGDDLRVEAAGHSFRAW